MNAILETSRDLFDQSADLFEQAEAIRAHARELEAQAAELGAKANELHISAQGLLDLYEAESDGQATELTYDLQASDTVSVIAKALREIAERIRDKQEAEEGEQ